MLSLEYCCPQLIKLFQREESFQWEESGSSAVELAFVIPVLLTILFGIIQFALVFTVQLGVQNASEVAARFAVLGTAPTEAEVVQTAVSALPPTVEWDTTNGDSVLVDSNYPLGGGEVGTRVQVTHNLPLLFPQVIIGDLSGSWPVTGTSVMR